MIVLGILGKPLPGHEEKWVSVDLDVIILIRINFKCFISIL